jgi:uncharacterized protein
MTMTGVARISATPRANAMLAELKAKHGAIVLHLSGRFGGTLACLPEGELRIGSRDVLAGEFSGIKLYMMTSEFPAWDGRDMVISALEGLSRGFSLEGASGYHFALMPIALPADDEY